MICNMIGTDSIPTDEKRSSSSLRVCWIEDSRDDCLELIFTAGDLKERSLSITSAFSSNKYKPLMLHVHKIYANSDLL